MSDLSKTQIDKLGERLKKGRITEDDLRRLDEYRLSFSEAYEFVVGKIKDTMNLGATGRPAKSTPSIVEKLKRESLRLTQMQDIAGCRIVIADIQAQDSVTAALRTLFDEFSIVDRRITPSHGYRAVHGIAKYRGRAVEVQIRTSAQHLWAELSEKLSDQIRSFAKIRRRRGILARAAVVGLRIGS